MSKMWTIQRIAGFDGQAKPIIEDVVTIHELEYHGEWMGKCFVTVNIKSPDPIDWHFDDFLEYRGEVFSISYDPNVVKKARRGTYADGFTYDNIKFFAIGDKTRFFGFKDVVLNQNSDANTQVYTSLATFSFFCSSVEDFADRLQANLDREDQSDLMRGRHFTVLTPSALRTTQRLGSLPAEWNTYFDAHDESRTVYIEGETDVNIDIDKQNCYDVLKYSYDKFGLSYFVKGTTIIIGGKPIHLNTGSQNIFRYGKGLGLYEVERTSDEDIEIVTKLFAYGSEQNLPLNYYAGLTLHVYLNMIVDETHVDGGTENGISVSLESVGYNSGTFIDKIYDFGNIRWYNVDCTIGDISFGGVIEAVKGGAYSDTVRLIADTNPGSVAGANKVTAEVGRRLKQLVGNGVPVYFTGGINKNRFPANRQSNDGIMPATLSINRLMLPGFPLMSLYDWVSANKPSLLELYDFSHDILDPWIKSKNLSVAGLFEGTVCYDGNQQREIYPTIENSEAGVVKADTEITDNGYLDDGTNIGFTLWVARGILNWKDALGNALEDVYIEMKSGFCIGRRFKVLSANESVENNSWVIRVERDKDTSTGRYFPYSEGGNSKYAQVKEGDTFVVTGIQMPNEYIEAAAEKMLIASCGYLDKRDHMRYTYLPKIDELFMQRDHDKRGDVSYYSTICAGMKLEFEDTDLGIWQTPYIDQLTIKENGNNGIPTYDVVLRDEKEKSKFEKMAERIEELTGATQVVERQSYPSMNIDYSEWVAGTPYYYQTLNTNPNPDISDRPYVETSYVWHRYKKWMCLRTLTQEEPKLGCNDWKVVEGNTNFVGEMLTSNGNVFRNGDVDTVLTMKVWWGDEDVTEQIKAISHQFSWSRSTGYDSVQSQFVQQSEDLTWEPDFVSEDKVHLVRGDMGSGWMITYRKALIACLVTFSLAQGEQTDVLGSYKF